MNAAPLPARWPARVFTGATLLWAGVIPAAAFGATATAPVAQAFVSLVYAMGHVLCHQRPERSFTAGGYAWPVCARCAGIYVGAAIGVMLAQSWRRVPEARVVRRWLAAAALPTLFTLLYEWTTGRMPAHAVRAVAGGLVGLVTAGLMVAFVRASWQTPRGSGPVAGLR